MFSTLINYFNEVEEKGAEDGFDIKQANLSPEQINSFMEYYINTTELNILTKKEAEAMKNRGPGKGKTKEEREYEEKLKKFDKIR